MSFESPILIVEDDAETARAWERTLRALRPVLFAQSAKQAIETFGRREHWAGVMIDVNLGGPTHLGAETSGIAVATHIREHDRAVPCAIVTGHHDQRDVVNAADRLDCRLVAKPATASQLRGFFLDVAIFDTDCDVATAAAIRRIAARSNLSPKEAAVLVDLVSAGQGRKETAANLGIEEGTLKTFAQRIREKLGESSLDGVRARVREEAERRRS